MLFDLTFPAVRFSISAKYGRAISVSQYCQPVQIRKTPVLIGLTAVVEVVP